MYPFFADSKTVGNLGIGGFPWFSNCQKLIPIEEIMAESRRGYLNLPNDDLILLIDACQTTFLGEVVGFRTT